MSHSATYSSDSRASLSTDSIIVAAEVANGLLIQADTTNDRTNIDTLVANQSVNFGSVTSTDVTLTGAAGSMAWDASADTLTVTGTLAVVPATVGAIAAARTMTAADSGGTFTVAKTGVYTVTLPVAAQGLKYKFLIIDNGNNVVTFTATGPRCYGTLNINNTLTQVAAQTNILSAAVAGVGDWIEFEGIDATHWLVTGACAAAADLSTS